VSIETLKQEFNVTTRYIHFPLHPDTPDEGISIENCLPIETRPI